LLPHYWHIIKGAFMLLYVVRRLLCLPIVMFLVTLILFMLMLRLPAETRAEVHMPNLRPGTTPEEANEILQDIIDRYGLDEPFPIQYYKWIRGLSEGEWGYSPTWKQPVLEGLMQRAPASAELGLAAMLPAVILALISGSMAIRFQGQTVDTVIRGAAFIGWAFPSFILGLMLMNVLYAWLSLFPPERLGVAARTVVEGTGFRQYTGMHTVDAVINGDLDVFIDAVRHLVLPAFTLGLAQWALLTRIMRSSLQEELRQDYVVTARAKGLTEKRVIGLHARRNAVLPVISTGSVAISMLISGVVVVEAVFNFNGIGRAATEAILLADLPAIVGFVIFTSLVTVLSSLIADILYAFVDPRVALD
jgi:peptide/nickel transport system permease protein